MSTTGKKSSSQNRNARAQLQRELQTLRAELEKKQDELTSCRTQLDEAQTQLQQPAAATTDRESAQLRLELNELKDQSLVWQEEIESLGEVNRLLTEEKAGLKSHLRQAKDNLGKRDQAAAREQREFERRKREDERRIKELEAAVQRLQSQLAEVDAIEEPIAGDLHSPKAVFRLLFYAGDQQLRGKIVHTLTKASERFSGLDKSAIFEFIARHLTAVTDESTKQAPETLDAVSSFDTNVTSGGEEPRAASGEHIKSRSDSLVPQQSPPLSVAELQALPVHEVIAFAIEEQAGKHRLSSGVPFRVRLEFAIPEQNAASRIAARCQVSIYAKSLAGGGQQLLGRAERHVSSEAQRLPVLVNCRSLEAGAYRLEAAITFAASGGRGIPRGDFIEGHFVHVA